MNRFARKEWKAFRAEMIERDGGRCARCTKSTEEGATLHVHHKEYVNGRMPWQYNYNQCELLCAGCHAAEHGKIPPPSGWDYQGDDDLGNLIGECEYCGTAIRYAFYIHHPRWEPLTVGTDCCDNLTGTELASNHMESVNRYRSRRTRFLSSSRWQTNATGLFIRQKRMDVQVARIPEGYCLVVNRLTGKRVFETSDLAKAALFELFENGAIERYFERIRPFTGGRTK
jgi:hypothetical protein